MAQFQLPPDLRKLLTANALSTAGDSATSLGVLLYISNQTGKAEPVVYLALIMALPRIAAMLIPGHLFDQLPKRTVLLLCEIVNALLTLLAAGIMLSGHPLWLFLVLFLKSSVTALYNPVLSSLLPSMVEEEHLMDAYSRLSTSNTVASVIGTAIAGFLITATGHYWLPLTVDALSFLGSFLIFLSLSIMPGEIEDETIDWKSTTSGVSIITGNPVLMTALLLGISLTIALEFYNILYVPLISQTLKAAPYWFSIVEAIQAIALVLAGYALTRLSGLNKKYQLVSVCAAAILGLSIMAMGLVGNIYLFAVAIFIMGLAEIPLSSAMQAVIQSQLTDNIRVRVAASINGATAAAEMVGLLACLLLINIVSVSNLFVLSGTVILLIALAAFMRQGAPTAAGEQA